MSAFKESFLVSQENVKLFAEVVGDPNPIHQDNEVARAMGLEGTIAHGMFSYCYLLRRLDQWMRQEATQGKKWELLSTRCRFHEPALIGKTFESILELADEGQENAKMNLHFMDGEKKLCHIVAQLKKKN